MKDSTALIKESVERLLLEKRTQEKAEKYYNDVRKKEQLAVTNFMFTNLPKGEETFDIEIDNDDAEQISTVGDAVEQIKNATNNN